MELFRVSRDVWGREMIQGMSWDLLWLFFGAGAAFIVLHALYRAFFARPMGGAATAVRRAPSRDPSRTW